MLLVISITKKNQLRSGRIELVIGLIGLGVGLIELKIGQIELGIGLMELLSGSKVCHLFERESVYSINDINSM